MLVNNKEITQYLDDYKNGRIIQGKGIGIKQADDYFRFKKGTFNMILGHDNMGKTYWRTWYYLVLSVKYDYKWCIWTGENKAGQIVRDLITFYSGKRITDLSSAEIYRYRDQINHWFKFVDNKRTYKYKELLTIFGDDDYTGCLIDPYTGLDRKFGHSDNYEFLNETRHWVNSTGKTIDVCTHPASASGRSQGMYEKGHDWHGHLREPYKADVEGGKPFANRCDDFITIHRLTKHQTMKTYTMIFIEKIKETETGGQQTLKDQPVLFEFNKGLGFTCADINPLTNKSVSNIVAEPKIEENNDFLNELPEVPF